MGLTLRGNVLGAPEERTRGVGRDRPSEMQARGAAVPATPALLGNVCCGSDRVELACWVLVAWCTSLPCVSLVRSTHTHTRTHARTSTRWLHPTRRSLIWCRNYSSSGTLVRASGLWPLSSELLWTREKSQIFIHRPSRATNRPSRCLYRGT